MVYGVFGAYHFRNLRHTIGSSWLVFLRYMFRLRNICVSDNVHGRTYM